MRLPAPMLLRSARLPVRGDYSYEPKWDGGAAGGVTWRRRRGTPSTTVTLDPAALTEAPPGDVLIASQRDSRPPQLLLEPREHGRLRDSPQPCPPKYLVPRRNRRLPTAPHHRRRLSESWHVKLGKPSGSLAPVNGWRWPTVVAALPLQELWQCEPGRPSAVGTATGVLERERDPVDAHLEQRGDVDG